MMRFKFLLVFVLLLKVFITFGQKKVDKLYSNHAYSLVVSKYEKLLKKDSGNCDIMHKLAVSYAHMNNSEAALKQYNNIISHGKSKLLDNYDWNTIGQLNLRFNERIKAEEAFRQINDSVSYFSERQMPDSEVPYKVINLENINTKFSDFSPFIFNDYLVFTSDRSYSLYGNEASNDRERSYLSLFSVTNDSILERKKIERFSGKINSGFENGTASFSIEGGLIFYTKSSQNEDGVNNSKIYSAAYNNNKWKNIHPISLSSDEYSIGHPIFIDELQILVFTSDMPGGYGEMDLYYSYWKNNEWSKPINFGLEVNTPFNEVFPSKQFNWSNEIYFSSNGRFGFGGLDVYKMTFTNEEVTSVSILPESVNSRGDDFGIYFTSSSTGFVSSDREGGQGGDDIYRFFIDSSKLKAKPLIAVKPFEFSGSIYDEESGLPIVDHKMYLLNIDRAIIDSTKTNIDGVFKFEKQPFLDVAIAPAESEEKDVSVKMKSTASKEYSNGKLFLMTSKKEIQDSVYLAEGEALTFFMESSDVDNKHKCVVYEDGKKAVKIVYVLKDSSGLILDSADHTTACLTIRKMFPEKELINLINDEDAQFSFGLDEKLSIPKDKDTIIVERIYFELDKIVITESAKKSLVKIIHALEQNPSVKLKITGHTDSKGDEAYNLKLSERRSKAIKQYLISNGINSRRLTSKGYGESRLANHCKDGVKCSENEHLQNRRIEFELTRN